MMPLYVKSPGNRCGAPLCRGAFLLCVQRVVKAGGLTGGWIQEPIVSWRAKPFLRAKTGQVADRRLICECLL